MCKKQSLIFLQSIFFPGFHRLFIFILQFYNVLFYSLVDLFDLLTLYTNDNHGSNKAKKKKSEQLEKSMETLWHVCIGKKSKDNQ